jgi:bifunctional non-homologous end joining protein LigD
MILHPIVPFEPKSTETIPQGESWIAQVKWDGVRILTYFNGSGVQLFNRKLHERTLQFPEFQLISAYCAAASIILDGEVIALVDGKPSFHEVMKRDSLRKIQSIEKVKSSIPLTYMIFDVLFYNGCWVIDLPLRQRQKLLAEIVQPNEQVQVIQSFTDMEALFTTIQSYDLEGVIFKDLNSTYAINGKDQRWQKKKNYKDLNAVIGGVTFRNGVVNSLLLGLYNQHHQFIYIGHAGTGKLNRQDWAALTEIVNQRLTESRPFVNEPQRNKDAHWVKPEITVKIQFIEWSPNHSLRQPSIHGLVHVSPLDCTMSQDT